LHRCIIPFGVSNESIAKTKREYNWLKRQFWLHVEDTSAQLRQSVRRLSGLLNQNSIFDPPMSERVAHSLGAVFHVELIEGVLNVKPQRALFYFERRGDLAILRPRARSFSTSSSRMLKDSFAN